MVADFPTLKPLLKEVRALQGRVAATPAAVEPPAPAPTEPEFRPATLPADVQDAVDNVPELLTWQTDPNQVAWRMAVAEDSKLREMPAWQTRSQAERLAEVARRVAADLGGAGLSPAAAPKPPAPPAQPSAAQRAQDRINNAVANEPGTIGDLGGGVSGANQDRSYADYSKMTDEQILGSLPG